MKKGFCYIAGGDVLLGASRYDGLGVVTGLRPSCTSGGKCLQGKPGRSFARHAKKIPAGWSRAVWLFESREPPSTDSLYFGRNYLRPIPPVYPFPLRCQTPSGMKAHPNFLPNPLNSIQARVPTTSSPQLI